MTVIVKLKKIWKNKSINNNTKLRLMKALVWQVATYGCEAWTMKKEEERPIQSFEMHKCIRKLLRIPWTKMMTNEQMYTSAGARIELLAHIKNTETKIFWTYRETAARQH